MHFSRETFYNRAFEQAEGNLIQEAKPLLRTPHSMSGHVVFSFGDLHIPGYWCLR